MNVELIDQAVELVGDKQLLINIVSKRVQQLNQGADPYVPTEPETGNGDVALMEILQGKIVWRAMTESEIMGDYSDDDFDAFEEMAEGTEAANAEPEAVQVTILQD